MIGLLYVAGLLAAAQFAKIALTLPALAAVYPGAPLSIAVSALSLTGILFGVVAGSIIARIGPRIVLLTALVGGAGVAALHATMPPFPVLLALRVAEGGAHLALVVAAPTLMARVATPSDTPLALGLWGTFFGVGFAISAVVLPWLGSPAALFAAHGVAMLLLAGVLFPILPRGTGGAAPIAEGWIARHRAIYASPHLMAAGLTFVWHTLVFLGLLTFLPRFLGAWAASLLPVAALLGTLGAGVLARRFPPLRLAQVGLFLALALGAGLVVAPAEVRFALAPLLFVVLGIVPGASFAAVPWLNASPADRARANGALAQLGNVGTALSTPVFAFAAVGGVPMLMATCGVLAMTGLFVVEAMIRQTGRIPVTGR